MPFIETYSNASARGFKQAARSAVLPLVSGGIITSDANYVYHTFTSNGTLTVNRASITVDYLVAAGGGSGNQGFINATGIGGGGGGAGGLLTGSSFSISANSSVAITIGAGGAFVANLTNNAANGSNSTFSSFTAIGGGGGGMQSRSGGNGGSGGGGGGNLTTGGTGTTGQGYAGATGGPYPGTGNGGGGGGAGGVGGPGGTGLEYVGGAGVASTISGSSVTYAAGGTGATGQPGGTTGVTGAAGTANTGNGGGGGWHTNAGGNGGSGVVIIRYPLSAVSSGSFELLGTVLLSATQASVTFNLTSAQQAAYKHLQLRVTQQNTGTSTDLNLRFNADSGNNYAYHYLVGNGTSALSGGGAFPDNRIRIGSSTDTATTGAFSGVITDLLDVFSATKNKTVRSMCAARSTEIQLFSGVWISTAATTSLVISPPTGSFTVGSRFSLYGVKG